MSLLAKAMDIRNRTPPPEPEPQARPLLPVSGIYVPTFERINWGDRHAAARHIGITAKRIHINTVNRGWYLFYPDDPRQPDWDRIERLAEFDRYQEA